MYSGHLCIIKFKHGEFVKLKTSLLKDLSKESFAVLIGKHEYIDNTDFINIYELVLTPDRHYNVQSHAFLDLNKGFIYEILADVTNRYDVDTIVDVHTHPFCNRNVSFSGVDDRDESNFYKFLSDRFDDLHYASIVLSQNDYSARIWKSDRKGKVKHEKAVIKTQTSMEQPDPEFEESEEDSMFGEDKAFFNRSVLALGLDVMRRIVSDQTISVVGVGGLGSVIAEHLVHMGFHRINLFDNDILEVSNLNRFVGGYYQDALKEESKVDVVKRHLTKINPNAEINAYNLDVSQPDAEKLIAFSDWILISTDNHSSRFRIQQLAFKYFIPFITSGVNITVKGNEIIDNSGEVITIRMGERFCLNCLGRINYIKIANEKHPSPEIRNELVRKGYVEGKDIKEPAVKTLNTMVATMSVNALTNQYTAKNRQPAILVYENNKYECIYEDKESLENRKVNCYTCNI